MGGVEVVLPGQRGEGGTDSIGQLQARGWTRRFITDVSRAREWQELYESLGYEVLLRPLTADDLPYDGCQDCFLARHLLRVIYTRPKVSLTGASMRATMGGQTREEGDHGLSLHG
jgi:hypothetical protein